MNSFLQSAKAAIQTLSNYESICVVLGNESCDLDSVVASLVYAFYLNSENDSDMPVIPVLNIKEDELVLRTESKYFLEKNGICTKHLVFRNEVNLTSLAKENKLKLVLVDHHILAKQDGDLMSSVIEIIDHRPIDPSANLKNISLNIDPVGSCCTLIAQKIFTKKGDILDDTLATLLHGTIILDTINFDINANRFTELDQNVVSKLEGAFTFNYSREEIFKELVAARNDVSSLTPSQILHRDLKIVNNLPVPGLPMLIIDFIELNSATESFTEFCTKMKCKVIVLMGLVTKNNTVYRDIAVFCVKDCELKTALVNHLRSTQELCLTQVDKNIQGLTLFSQGNVKASRKHIVPILKTVLENRKDANIL